MNIKRILLGVGVGIVMSSVGAITACSAPTDNSAEKIGAAAANLEAANVTVVMHDRTGAVVGEGAGVLLGPNIVLTSGHLVAGTVKWTVKTADGKKQSTGVSGKTFDWRIYNSMKSHPRKHDVGIIYLDKAIELSAYPKLATARQADGTAAARTRSQGATFEILGATLSRTKTMPNNYFTDMSKAETVSTGGAVINQSGEIVGVVAGRGMQTGKLYIARVDRLVKWLTPKIVCGGGKVSTSSGSIAVKTYGAPPPKKDCEKDAGSSSSSSGSSGNSSGGNSSGGGGGGGGGGDGDGSGGGGGGGGGGPTGDCDDGGGIPSGGGDSTGDSDSSVPGGNDDNGGGGSGGSDDTTNGGGDSTGDSDKTTTGGQGGGGSGSGDSDGEHCEGESDDSELCPPESKDCEGPGCGGGTPDSTIDMGGGRCGTCTSSSTTGTLPPLR